MGFYNQYGFKSEWANPDEFTGRYICTECKIRARNLNPTVAYKIEDRLAIGVGVDMLFASFDHQQRLLAEPNPFPEPTDVAELTIDGASDTSFGWNVGILAAPSESFSIGLHYRSKVSATYTGEADFNQILTGNDVVDTIVAASLPPRQPVEVEPLLPLQPHRGDRHPPGELDGRGRHRLLLLGQLRRRDLLLPGAGGRPGNDGAGPGLPQRLAGAPRASSTC